MANINSFKRLIILKSSLKTVVIGSYIVGIAGKPIFKTFLVNSSSNSVLFTLSILSTLSLVVSPRALKAAFNLSFLISSF